jgi:predicted Fe-S protein YdhL (DUF1289 family)
MDAQEYDRYSEYQEAMRESEEMDSWVAQRDAERERVLATLTKEERTLLDDLNEKMNRAFKKMCLLQNKGLRAIAEYNNARNAYRKAAEKWPVLKDGY